MRRSLIRKYSAAPIGSSFDSFCNYVWRNLKRGRDPAQAVLIVALFLSLPVHAQQTALPAELQGFVGTVEIGKLGNAVPELRYTKVAPGLIRASVSWTIADTIHQDDLQINITPAFKPVFNWAPHLTPTDHHIIAQHLFRSPAMIAASKEKQITIIPDIGLLKKGSPVDWYMDMNAPESRYTIGFSNSVVTEHVLFSRKKGAIFPPGKIESGFYILTATGAAALKDPWRGALSFFWKNYGEELYRGGAPLERKDMESYVGHAYNWAFNSWRKSVWQEFPVNGKEVGAPVFIVNVTQSPNYPGDVNEREFRSVWNQAWFSSLRSAVGLYRYARRIKDSTLMGYALKTKELALSYPRKNGFFYSVIGTEMEQVEKDGKKLNRSKGWDTYYFGNSNRNPYSRDAAKSPFHILDMSFTASLMLTWYADLEKDKRLLDYSISYADALIGIQRADGFFPAWLRLEDLQPMDQLNQSPESSMSVTFLLQLYRITKNEKYKSAALRALDAVVNTIIPAGQWEDFETYWSCSRYGSKDHVGRKFERNDMFKQCNFSMFWTAEALLAAYRVTGKKTYLENGQRTLDELLMTQASWQPPYIYINALGGFGVMNGDGEWMDSRQCLFSGLIVDYGKELKKDEYIQRGLAALRASFVMMYSPENPKTKIQWERKWPFFGKEDYGFMMENYGHGGETGEAGVGIGEFTIYDWGNGAAAESYNSMVDRFGKKFVENE